MYHRKQAPLGLMLGFGVSSWESRDEVYICDPLLLFFFLRRRRRLYRLSWLCYIYVKHVGGLECRGSVLCDALGTLSWAVSILVGVCIICVVILCGRLILVSLIVKVYIYVCV